MANADITQLMDDWPYQPGRLQARLITAHDGRVRIQLRLNLGVVQMYPSGRPDGNKPHGMLSQLHVCNDRQAKFVRTGAAMNDFQLTADECVELREEFAQYYQRCVAMMVLDDHASVKRDAKHNLRIINFCRRFAGDQDDRTTLMRFWSHVEMTLARACAMLAIDRQDAPAALRAIERGMNAVHKSYIACGRRKQLGQSPEVELLQSMRERLIEQTANDRVDLTDDARARLAEQLQAAVADEKYELAIALQDQLHAIERDGDEPSSS